MISNIIKVAETLDSSEKIEEKFQIVDICYDIMDTVDKGSRDGEAELNVLIVEKIVENIVKRLDESELESINAESFIKMVYKYLYKSSILVTPDALLKVKIIEKGYTGRIKNNQLIKIIDQFNDLDLLEKTTLSIIYKEYEGFLGSGAYRLFGARKGQEVVDEFIPKSLGVLITSLDEAMIDDEMTIDELVSELHSKFSKLSKDIYLNKYKDGDFDLRKCSLSNIYTGKEKKDIIPIFISDIYERTAFINEEDSDEEFIKDCCNLLDISENEYEKSCLLPGKVSYLKLTRIMRQMNSIKGEE